MLSDYPDVMNVEQVSEALQFCKVGRDLEFFRNFYILSNALGLGIRNAFRKHNFL